jgi:NADH-quinone oxidoreductase subunit H
MNDIVEGQKAVWYVFLQIPGFIIYCIGAVAEVNRAPFDLPEAEQELVAGYHTEYGGMRFAMFFAAEYINMVTVSAIATTMFLGGWQPPLPFLPVELGPLWFVLKVLLFLFGFVWLRATLPRLKYDRLMQLGWKWLLPIAILNLAVTSVVVALVS